MKKLISLFLCLCLAAGVATAEAESADAAEMQYLRTDNHPVECYRCNIPVQNFDEFLETYGVKEGDGMYLAPEDRIRVW